MLRDKFGRNINYLRISTTDVCNLRCFYCMPENTKFQKKNQLLNLQEFKTLIHTFLDLGISKIRVTGGEPLLREDLMSFLVHLKQDERLKKLCLTTNATLTKPLKKYYKYFDEINVSLDSLDPDRFLEITKKPLFNTVWDNILFLLQQNVTLKLNMVVIDGKNIEDILPMVKLTRDLPISVRFIEEMPFNGFSKVSSSLTWNYKKITDHIADFYDYNPILDTDKNSTSNNYKVNGFKGSFGVIAAYSRPFCGSCNRLRVSANGTLRNCLYNQKGTPLKPYLNNIAILKKAIIENVHKKALDGWNAAGGMHLKKLESMNTIGG